MDKSTKYKNKKTTSADKLVRSEKSMEAVFILCVIWRAI